MCENTNMKIHHNPIFDDYLNGLEVNNIFQKKTNFLFA